MCSEGEKNPFCLMWAGIGKAVNRHQTNGGKCEKEDWMDDRKVQGEVGGKLMGKVALEEETQLASSKKVFF